MKKVIVLWSSPNGDGLTAAAKDSLLAGLRAGLADAREVQLNKLRIEHGDVYAVNCGVEDKQLPLSRMACVIGFTCDPTQRERIAQDVDRLVHEMAEGDLITQNLIDSFVKEREKHAKDNNFGNRYYDLLRLARHKNGHSGTQFDGSPAAYGANYGGRWLAEKLKNTYVRMNDKYKDCSFQYQGWVK